MTSKTPAAAPLAGDVAANVRAEMAAQRMSIAALADTLGVSGPAASRRLNGQQEFTLTEVAKISDWLGMPVSALMARRVRQAEAVAS